MRTGPAQLSALILLSALSGFALRAEEPVVPPAGEPTTDAAEPDPFPKPEAIRGNVDFWTRVFSEWGLGQVAIHDMARPGVVYEVAQLPGRVMDGGYTTEQQAFVDRLRGRWEGYLQTLENKVKTGQPLDEIDSQWALYVAGTDPNGLIGAKERVRSQRGLRERFRAGLERSQRYEKKFREIFREAGLPEDLAYLPHIESSFHEGARSSAGAVGMWQFTRPAAKIYMTLSSAVDERLDPIAAARGAAGYLRDAHDRLGVWPLAVTSYNHGVDGMTAARERFGEDFGRIYNEYDGKYFGFASKNFYAEFLAAREIANHASRYFPEGYTPAPEHDHDQVVLDRRMSAASVAKTFGVPVGQLLSINPAWSPRAVKAGTGFPQGLRVWLPHGTLDRRTPTTNRQAPAAEAPAARASTGSGHVVQRGESLNEIASRYGVDVTALRDVNGMDPGASMIHAGQRLIVPEGDGGTPALSAARKHTVRSGDTLMRIATAYRVRLGDLLRVNTLSDRSVIRPGQILHIPN